MAVAESTSSHTDHFQSSGTAFHSRVRSRPGTPSCPFRPRYGTTSTSTTIAHMYSGSVRLSFCTLNASSSPASPATITNRPTCQSRRQSRFCSPFSRSPLVRTEKFSTVPNTRNNHAHTDTDATNATLPSIVFGFAANHRWRPSRLPTIDACDELCQFRSPPRHSANPTRASPTPNTSVPVNWSSLEGLSILCQHRYASQRR